jgi:hypothetical protein
VCSISWYGARALYRQLVKLNQAKQNTVKRYTLNSATPIGANTMFLQIGKCHTPFFALHHFFPILPIICSQVAAKLLYEIQNGVHLKLKNIVQRPNTEASPTG